MKKIILLTILLLLIPNVSFGAIGFDSSAEIVAWASSGTSFTVSYTTSGDDRLLIVAIFLNGSSDLVTGVTYNGTSMTKTNFFDVSEFYQFRLLNPASGANNIVLTLSSSGLIQSHAASYTGVAQSGLPDSYVTASYTNSTSKTVTTTTVEDNTWLIATGRAGGFSCGTNCTVRQAPGGVGLGLWDSNSDQTPAGSHSMNWTAPVDTRFWGAQMISVEPVASAATPTIKKPNIIIFN